MQHTTTRRVDDEVEGSSKGKEGDKVQSFVGLAGDILLCGFGCLRQGGVWEEADGGGEQEEDEEADWRGQ